MVVYVALGPCNWENEVRKVLEFRANLGHIVGLKKINMALFLLTKVLFNSLVYGIEVVLVIPGQGPHLLLNMNSPSQGAFVWSRDSTGPGPVAHSF